MIRKLASALKVWSAGRRVRAAKWYRQAARQAPVGEEYGDEAANTAWENCEEIGGMGTVSQVRSLPLTPRVSA